MSFDLISLDDMYQNFMCLVDEFNYEKNGIQETKYFIKYLLSELYSQALKIYYEKEGK